MARCKFPDLRSLASLASLTLCLASPAPAQQAQLPLQAPPTQASIAASPAATRLKKLLEVMNSGDSSATRAYVIANAVDPTTLRPGTLLPLVGKVLDIYRQSRGLDLLQIRKATDAVAVATVRDRITGSEHTLGVRTEPKTPSLITSVDLLPPPADRPHEVSALSERARFRQIRDYLKPLADADVFSGVVTISRGGKTVFSQAYGYADRERKIANSINTPFLLGSVNKLFTGLAIGQLVEQHKLSYDDPLSKFMPDFPDPESAKRIKIKHLLSHTSGLGDFFTPAFFNSIDRLRTVQSVIDVAGKEPPKFEPGTNWSYSNLGFQILGRIIEIVARQDYYDYMQANVFDRAGMKQTSFPDYDRPGVIIAQPYEIEFDGEGLHYVDQIDRAPRRGGPAGNGISTAPDLIRFANALHAGRIVSPKTFELHSSPKPELSSPKYGYGFSTVAMMAPRPLVGHEGGLPGECAQFGDLRDTPYTIVVLSNTTINQCITVTGKILEVLGPRQALRG